MNFHAIIGSSPDCNLARGLQFTRSLTGFSHDNYWKMCLVITYRFILLIDAINAVVEPHYYSCGRVRESERDRDSTEIIRRFIIIGTLFISGK